MRITALAENISHVENLGSEHGLSLYIETEKHKLLFDTGQSSLFAENAVKLGVDLSLVDLCVISHGHYDHGGGLRTFFKVNNNSPVYANIKAFGEYYANRPDAPKEYIGLDKTLPFVERFVFTGGYLAVEDGLEIFSTVTGQTLQPAGNSDLFEKIGDSFVSDSFAHEQNLIITENGKTVLIAGCAHKGIINIVESFHDLKGHYPDYVVGGFHLYNRASNGSEDEDTINAIGRYLLLTGSKYYTCHCTGMAAYNSLKTVMTDKIDYLSTGNQINN
jgi:7,8-dihydropterin-6-yl-methyl-4-(beta-D-ribofuranosyl)aminobenzene 5'-phosphate synthase